MISAAIKGTDTASGIDLTSFRQQVSPVVQIFRRLCQSPCLLMSIIRHRRIWYRQRQHQV